MGSRSEGGAGTIVLARQLPSGDPWFKLRPHAEQQRYWYDKRRFVVVPAGRRSGKTLIAIRRALKKAFKWRGPRARCLFCAPTREHAKMLFWDTLKAMVPSRMRVGSPREVPLEIELVNGAILKVVGLDKPARAEGFPVFHAVMDEYADMKEEAWPQHVRLALSDLGGSADFIGVPAGRTHYYDLWCNALADETGEWSGHTWTSEGVLPAKEIEQLKHDLDELTYDQEVRASFIEFAGRAYYAFSRDQNVAPCEYDPNGELVFCFDFNVSPGVAAVVQERQNVTLVVGEVYIPDNSTTPMVCRRLIGDWGGHLGRVVCRGDPTGGNRGTAKVAGSDWDIAEVELRPAFGPRLSFDVPRHAGPERARVNATNSRCRSAAGDVRFYVDPRCKMVIRDLEGTPLVKGGSGEIDKKKAPKLSHVSDALSYHLVRTHPVGGGPGAVVEQF